MCDLRGDMQRVDSPQCCCVILTWCSGSSYNSLQGHNNTSAQSRSNPSRPACVQTDLDLPDWKQWCSWMLQWKLCLHIHMHLFRYVLIFDYWWGVRRCWVLQRVLSNSLSHRHTDTRFSASAAVQGRARTSKSINFLFSQFQSQKHV